MMSAEHTKKKGSFLPSIRGGKFSSSPAANRDTITTKTHGSTMRTDTMQWKNSAMKQTLNFQHSIYSTRKDLNINTVSRREKRPNLGYVAFSPKTSMASDATGTNTIATGQVVDINDFVKTYVQKRMLFPQKESVKRRVKNVNIFPQKEQKEAHLVPLKFTEDVISSRGDPRLVSYDEKEMNALYKMENLSVCSKRRRDGCLKEKHKRPLPQKHKLCIPINKPKREKFPHQLKYSWKSESDEIELSKDQEEKSTDLWEKFVLGLISMQTAQWIANHCSSGEQRSRLISYLDDKFKIENTEKDGTATVRKLLDINDDSVSPKRGDNTDRS